MEKNFIASFNLAELTAVHSCVVERRKQLEKLTRSGMSQKMRFYYDSLCTAEVVLDKLVFGE